MARTEPPNTSPILTFQPRARIIRTLGDRLVSGPIPALIELVKNAHDADAGYVRITFTPPLQKGAGSIEIEDDGHGMTLGDLRDKWMEPATSNKVVTTHSSRGRRMLGSKGIGRFAVASLGHTLSLLTTSFVGSAGKLLEKTNIPELNWDIFEDSKYLSEIQIPYETHRSTKGTPGTIITISNLRDDWTKNTLENLHKELRRLISPLQQKEQSDFKIYLDLSRCTKENCGFDGGAIVNGQTAGLNTDEHEAHLITPYSLLSACDYEIKGRFSKAGSFDGTMKIHRSGGSTHKLEFDVPLSPEKAESSCGELLVHLAIFDRETDAIDNIIDKAGLGEMGRREARRLLDEMCGVAIYRDQFRIRPYGDYDQDWLSLDARRVQDPSFHIGHNQVAGLVVVGDEKHSGLVERSSREGLENNGSFRRLVRLLLELFGSRLEPLRLDFRTKAGISRRRHANSLAQAFKTAELPWTGEVLSMIKGPDKQRLKEKIDRETSKLRQQLEAVEQMQMRMQAQATLGLILAEVLHQGRAPVAFIQSESKRLSKWLPNLCEDSEKATERRTVTIPKILNGLENSAETLRKLFKTLDPLSGRKRGPPRTFDAVDLCKETLNLFSSRLSDLGIATTLSAEAEIPSAHGYQDDLATALTNLIDNSIHWLDHSKTKVPAISIEIGRAKKTIVIDVSDNGPGVPSEFTGSIFDVGFTLKHDGTGLGLPIAREALGRSNGTIQLQPSSKGTSFRIIIPSE